MDSYLSKHGLKEVVEDCMKELLLNRPIHNNLADGAGSPICSSHDQAAMEFLASVLGERLGLRSKQGKAVRLVKNCQPRCAAMIQDNAAEAFMLLAGLGEDSECESAAISAVELNQFLEQVCEDLPKKVAASLLSLIQLDQDQVYLVSFNDFMCALNPYIATKEFVSALMEDFETLDDDDDGFIALSEAFRIVKSVNWVIPDKQRRAGNAFSVFQQETDESWQSWAKQIVSQVPRCPVTEHQNDNNVLLMDTEAALRTVATSSRRGGTQDACVSREDFVTIVTLQLSPLAQFIATWTKTG